MNGILYMDVSVFEDVLLYEKGKTLLSAERRMYMEKLKNPKAARLSLGAGVLLFFALQKCNYTEQLEKIKKTPLGKPYLKGIDFQFNLSHSGTYALCAYSNRNIGADLQQIKEKLPEKTEKILSKDDLRSRNKHSCFIDFGQERKALLNGMAGDFACPCRKFLLSKTEP